jgi:hypothetical protein
VNVCLRRGMKYFVLIISLPVRLKTLIQSILTYTDSLIEKERKLLYGQKCRVFLNNRLYKCYDGV